MYNYTNKSLININEDAQISQLNNLLTLFDWVWFSMIMSQIRSMLLHNTSSLLNNLRNGLIV